MRPTRALQFILGLSLFGTIFSGVLSYRELFGHTAMSCPAPGAPGTVFGYPACIYGFFMYVAVAAIATAGLRGARKQHQAPGNVAFRGV
ncbi:MAG TPA: hypothetical protein VFD64_02010 [Gemmatimonadaceae bacterium]|nr:hypothetical protein [Gemmatimonadaceae bacterium]